MKFDGVIMNMSDNIYKGKSATRAKNKYNAHNYDSMHIVVPKGDKSRILAVADSAGDSLNRYVKKAIAERMERAEHPSTKMYTIIGGVNGTGKSSFTGVLKTRTSDLGTVIDVDKLTAEAGVSPIEGGKIALCRISECLEKGINFTQETTLAGHRTKITASKAKAQGYNVRLFYIGLDTLDDCLKRIANRVVRGGHNIDEKDVCRRFMGRWKALNTILPYCDNALFFDNDNGFVEVAEYRNGILTLKDAYHPAWILELSRNLM
ncbi:MAG: hypothetical protein LBD23_09275 [Oscillospiraceae bacterium]|nr:hypothetical protein [Oscillospiraceae bacterium]